MEDLRVDEKNLGNRKESFYGIGAFVFVLLGVVSFICTFSVKGSVVDFFTTMTFVYFIVSVIFSLIDLLKKDSPKTFSKLSLCVLVVSSLSFFISIIVEESF